MSKNRDIDIIRALATCMVVFIHVAGGVFSRTEYISPEWWIANLTTALLRQCVPLFVMISGALLLKSKEDVNVFYKKRMNKIFVPLLIGTLMYIPVNIVLKYSQGISFKLTDILWSIYKGEPFYHLWYLYMIIGIYGITPLLRLIIQSISRKYAYIIAIIAMILSGVFGIEQLLNLSNINFFLFKSLLYIGYYLMGYLIYQDKDKLNIYFIDYFLVFISITSIVLGNMLLPQFYFLKQDYVQMYNSIPVLIAAVSTFKILLKIRISDNIYYFLSKISMFSMGIYIIHPIVILITGRIYHICNFSSMVTIIIMFFDMLVSLLISYCISVIIKKRSLIKIL